MAQLQEEELPLPNEVSGIEEKYIIFNQASALGQSKTALYLFGWKNCPVVASSFIGTFVWSQNLWFSKKLVKLFGMDRAIDSETGAEQNVGFLGVPFNKGREVALPF